jgi:hypothetical protein
MVGCLLLILTIASTTFGSDLRGCEPPIFFASTNPVVLYLLKKDF